MVLGQLNALRRWMAGIATSVASLLALAAPVAAPALADDGRATRLVVTLDQDPETLVFNWEGQVFAPMAIEIRAAYEQWKSLGKRRIILNLNSPGGSVEEGARVISVLADIKRTHQLATVVLNGNHCGSMCIPIFLQGERRVAAPSSSWLFHEVVSADLATGEAIAINPGLSEAVLVNYYRPAGVNARWITEMKQITRNTDYWMTGQELANSGAGIVHALMPNRLPRNLPGTRPAAPAPAAAPAPTAAPTAALPQQPAG